MTEHYPPDEFSVEEMAWSAAETFTRETELLIDARRHADSFGGQPATPASTALLTVLAASLAARSVVEVGTGTGLTATALLRGMHADGVLTTIDFAPEQQRIAREVFAAGDYSGRTRLISDYPLHVLPRLADASYDLVYLDVLTTAPGEELEQYAEQSLRLLRPGGMLVVDKAIAAAVAEGDDEGGNASHAHAAAVRQFGTLLRDDERVHTAMVPVGFGLLVAVRL